MTYVYRGERPAEFIVPKPKRRRPKPRIKKPTSRLLNPRNGSRQVTTKTGRTVHLSDRDGLPLCGRMMNSLRFTSEEPNCMKCRHARDGVL